jgi:hypothetical protein
LDLLWMWSRVKEKRRRIDFDHRSPIIKTIVRLNNNRQQRSVPTQCPAVVSESGQKRTNP